MAFIHELNPKIYRLIKFSTLLSVQQYVHGLIVQLVGVGELY